MKSQLSLQGLSISYGDGSRDGFAVDIYQPQWAAGSPEQELD
jgi:hypothetical protein